MRFKNSKKVYLSLLFICLLAFQACLLVDFNTNNYELPFQDIDLNPPKTAYFNNSMTPISIDDTDPGSDWAWAANQSWCTKKNGIYYIENLTIKNEIADGIHIENSNKLFVIRNCTLFNLTRGIFMDNVSNSQLISNNCSYNEDYGIYLYSCRNNTLSNNTASNSQDIDGILLTQFSRNNTITNNFLCDNKRYGLFLQPFCSNNTISKNRINSNTERGVYISSSDNVNITGNEINNNGGDGIELSSCSYTRLIFNVLNNNDDEGIDEVATDNTYKKWNLINWQTEKIVIDDNGGGDFTWSQAKKNLAWCKGSGVREDPYLIEKITINGNRAGNCIEIRDSSIFFTIRDCTFFNASSGMNDSGIKLYRTSNGTLINNNCSNNQYSGITLYDQCQFNNIMNNIINDNGLNGIHILIFSEHNIILNNTLHGNTYNIYIQNMCSNNVISNNTASSASSIGIYINGFCENNTISNNTVNDNGAWGLYLATNCNENNITYNDFNENLGIGNDQDRGILINNCDKNRVINNSMINNLEHGIRLLNSHENVISGNTVTEKILPIRNMRRWKNTAPSLIIFPHVGVGG